MDKPKLIRRRYIPDEAVELNGDEIVRIDDDVIVTRWTPIRKRAAGDFAGGASVVYKKRGFKLSALFGADGALMRYYADILATEYNAEENTYTFRDLLADVVIQQDGRYKVIDLDELADALESGLISREDCCFALRALNSLLWEIYGGGFEALAEPLIPIAGETVDKNCEDFCCRARKENAAVSTDTASFSDEAMRQKDRNLSIVLPENGIKEGRAEP